MKEDLNEFLDRLEDVLDGYDEEYRKQTEEEMLMDLEKFYKEFIDLEDSNE